MSAMNKNDIELEMSRFEEEITKLTPTATTTTHSVAETKSSGKLKINIQIPTSLSFSAPQSAVSYQQPNVYQQPQIPTHQLAYAAKPEVPRVPQTYPHIPHAPNKEALKRDSSGNVKSANKPPTSSSTVSATSATAATTSEGNKAAQDEKDKKKKKVVRCAGGETWQDDTLLEWDPDDFRLFCGDLGHEVTDEMLARAFSKYPSFLKCKVVRDRRTSKSKGYGFVSFKSSDDFIKAMREMNGKYVGNRPIKLRKSTWRDRNIETVKKRELEKKAMGLR